MVNSVIQKIFITKIFQHYKDTKCHLNYDPKNTWTLLFAVILSAQCTDKKVNQVTPLLFKKFPKLQNWKNANLEEIKKIIYPLGLSNTKSKNLKKCAEQLIYSFDSKLPDSIEKLTILAGVGRKTANIILWNIFGKNIGFAVDTHVKRIMQKTGFTKNQTPEKIEKDLIKKIPQNKWGPMSHKLIQFGREICTAKSPKCKNCFFKNYCSDFYKKNNTNKNILSIDFGSKFCGLAFSPDAKVVFPLKIIETEKIENELKKIIQEKNIQKIIFGFPIYSNKEENILCKRILEFAEILENIFEYPILFVDEKLSTKIAKNILDQKKIKSRTDDIAAMKILEFYLQKN